MTKSSAPKLYIDSCCFIDLVKIEIGEPTEHGRDAQVQRLKLILEASKNKDIALLTSTITVVECLHANNRFEDVVKNRFSRLLTSGQYVSLITPDVFIAEAARDVRWIHGIGMKPLDYIHIASAVDRGCAEFLTMDGDDMLKKKDKIKAELGIDVVTPLDSRLLPSSYLQMTMGP